jgi:two-component system, NtrC family, sensor kinase
MRRGAKPAKAEAKPTRLVPAKSRKNKGSGVGDLEKRLAEALEQQTATADILRIITRSRSDIRPVFDLMTRSAVQLCRGRMSTAFWYDGDLIHMIAGHGTSPEMIENMRSRYPMPAGSSSLTARAIRDRWTLHVRDLETDPEVPEATRGLARLGGYRSQLNLPILREGQPVGVIAVVRVEPGGFSDAEIALLQTFADQAVIAIENVSLFKELEARTNDLTRSVGELRALGDVSRALSSTLDLDTVLETIVTRASQLAGGDACSVFEYEEATGGLPPPRHAQP